MADEHCFSIAILTSFFLWTMCDGCMQTIPVEDITSMCIDPSLLFVDIGIQKTTLSATGTQPIGSTVTVTCFPGDSILVATFDDGSTGREDSEAEASRIEIVTLTCESDSKWFVSFDDFFNSAGGVITPPITTSGTVSAGSIQCRAYFPNNVP